jgi:hypothetical protein
MKTIIQVQDTKSTCFQTVINKHKIPKISSLKIRGLKLMGKKENQKKVMRYFLQETLEKEEVNNKLLSK